MYYNILDLSRKKLLNSLKKFRNDFYLAGGTALALQIGHRDSIDFDYFTKKSIDTNKLFSEINTIFFNEKVIKFQEEKNTLGVTINNIQISFFTYPYDLVKETITDEYFNFASLEDIACMKLSTITSRSELKDYVDLYFLLQKFPLKEIIPLAKGKFENIDVQLFLKSLVYFDDIEDVPIMFKTKSVNIKTIENYLKKVVREYYQDQSE